MTSGRSSDASVAAGTATTGSILDPPTYGHGIVAVEDRHGPRRRSSTTSPRCSGRGRASSSLSAHTPGYDGERLAALCREHLGAGAASGELRLIARSGNVLRLGGWARSPER